MVAVDDVHWADRVTRRSIDELMSAFADRPLSVLLCSRPAERTPTDDGWVAARPSGTEDLYKLYAESFVSPDQAGKLLEEGKVLISKALNK